MSHTHFHVILPSDSSIQYYPNNTVAKYVTKLSERISLDGEYELGLSEIIYPYSWYNVDNTSSNLWLDIVKLADDPNSYDKPLERHEISSGYYGDGLSFAKNITGAAANIFDWDDCVVQFTFNDSSRKLVMLLRCGQNIVLNMSSEFMTKFGFDHTGPYKTGSYNAACALDLNAGVNLMYVYCDIAAYTAVGDTKAPLLLATVRSYPVLLTPMDRAGTTSYCAKTE